VEEAQREGRTWREVKWLAADRSRWRSFMKAFCFYTGDNRNWWSHENIWGTGGITPQFLTSALDGGEWLALRPGRFNPGERVPGTHGTGGWWVPEPVWTLWSTVKSFCLFHESIPGRPARSSLWHRPSNPGFYPMQ
jgi:hypothetical protein